MERVIILKNTVTGQQLTMPVTPPRYPVSKGRAVERLDMAQTGQIALPGLTTLMAENLEVMFPSQLYSFCTAGAVAEPQHYIETLTEWGDRREVCRYIVSGAGVNIPVLLGPLSYEERDGTNDVYAVIPLYEYRYLDEVIVEQTQNAGRPVENTNQAAAAQSYTVQAGDTLWSICQQFYGDGSLAPRLAAANGIANPNILQAGQVLNIPPLDELPEAATYTYTPSEPETMDDARGLVRETLGFQKDIYAVAYGVA